MQLRALTVDTDIPAYTESPPAAHSIHVVVSGEVRCRFEEDHEIGIYGPSLCLNCPAKRPHQIHLFGRRNMLRVVTIDFTPDTTSDAWSANIRKLAEELGYTCCPTDPIFFHCPAQGAIASIATQILTCPLQGPARGIYLSGLAFQLLAMAFEFIGPFNGRREIKDKLSPSNLAIVDCIKCILRDRYDRPPALTELARLVGVGPKRLTALFRQECGLSIGDFLQEHRLERAYYLLSHTNLQIAEIAHRVGYTPPYLSTAFKKRFGQKPSELRSCGG